MLPKLTIMGHGTGTYIKDLPETAMQLIIRIPKQSKTRLFSEHFRLLASEQARKS